MSGFWFGVSMFVVFMASMILPALIALVLPGRKGSMRTRREVVHDRIGLVETCDLYARRLEHDGFDVDRSEAPHLLKAKRGSLGATIASGEIVTHASKPTSVQVQLAADGTGVVVTAEAWLNDFVLLDTGEGQHMDLLLHRLTEADLEQEPPPKTPLTYYAAMIAMCAALIICAAPWLLRTVTFTQQPPERWRGLLIGLLVGGVGQTFIGAAMTFNAIAEKPGEIRGKALAILAVVTALVGAVICGLALWGKL